jgi:hypothetical protein
MWIIILIAFFALGTFAIFASKQNRELLHFSQFVLGVAAFAITLLCNRIRTGLFFPGIKKKS